MAEGQQKIHDTLNCAPEANVTQKSHGSHMAGKTCPQDGKHINLDKNSQTKNDNPLHTAHFPGCVSQRGPVKNRLCLADDSYTVYCRAKTDY